MAVLIIDCGSSKSPAIKKTVEELGFTGKVIQLNKFNEDVLQHYNAVIISGAPILLTEIDPLPYLNQLRFLKNTTLPVLGICFGHQIMGMHFGATIYKCQEDRTSQVIRFSPTFPLNCDLDIESTFIEDHCEAISLANNFNLYGSSSICEVEAMKHKTKSLFGVQFHPEVSGENGKILIRNFLNYRQ